MLLHGQRVCAALPLVVIPRRNNRCPPAGLPCVHKYLCHVRQHVSFDVVTVSFDVVTVSFDVVSSLTVAAACR